MTFGDYISKYTIGRSIEDGATVPIYYENRRVPIEIDDPALLTEVEEVLEEEDDTARRRLMTRWAQLAAVVGADDRLRRDPMQAQLFGDKLQSVEPDEVERDIREELRSVRTQVAQGLPVTRRWTIDADLGPVGVGSRDAVSYLWQIARGDETRRIQVFISGTATSVDNDHLPSEVANAKETNGRSVVASLLALDDPPSQVMATTAGIRLTLPD